MTTQRVISCSPDVVSGTPVFIGTRVPIKNLFDYMQGGESLDAFLDDFPSVRREQAVEVLALALDAVLAQLYAHPADDNLPRQLKRQFPDHTLLAVQERGWSSTKNGELLRLAAAEFDVFMTADQNLPFQQSVTYLDIAVLVLVTRDIRLQALRPLLPQARAVLPMMQPGAVVHIPF